MDFFFFFGRTGSWWRKLWSVPNWISVLPWTVMCFLLPLPPFWISVFIVVLLTLPHHHILDILGRELEVCFFSSLDFRSRAALKGPHSHLELVWMTVHSFEWQSYTSSLNLMLQWMRPWWFLGLRRSSVRGMWWIIKVQGVHFSV